MTENSSNNWSWGLTSRMKRPIHCAGPFYSVAGDICGESCPPTRHGGRCKSKREDLERIRVFPRAQWRKVANGSFLLRDIVRQIKNTPFRGRTRDFIAKVQAFSYRLRTTADDSAVLLIGVDDNQLGDGVGRQSPVDGGFAGVARDLAEALPGVLWVLGVHAGMLLV